MVDWSIIVSVVSLLVAGLVALTRTLDKGLSIREHEAYKDAVTRDIHRVENRLDQIERTRPTTGELEILSEALNKRLDEISRRTKL